MYTGFLLFLTAWTAFAQAPPAKKQVVHWTLQFDPPRAAPGGMFRAKLIAKIDQGWHMYSLTTPKGGGLPTIVKFADNPVLGEVRIFQPKPEPKFDPNFGVNTERYEGETTFYAEGAIKPDSPAGAAEISAQIRYSACTDKECLPPRRVTASSTLEIAPDASTNLPALPANFAEAKVTTTSSPTPPANEASKPAGTQNQGFGTFLLLAFGAGLAAIFTPCVFPMIPITLSYFLRGEQTTRAQSIRQAGTFCLGIILLFTLLGIVLTAALGPFAVVQLANNPWVNAIIALVFLAFGLSLLGAFEITLPSGIVNRLDRASQGGGVAGTLLMGLTFSVTSFACVGPFVGTLLAASVQGGKLQPVLGMASFATGLASPFFLLAMFPAYLRRLPRSGGWMIRVKVVLGFIVLAAMLAYLAKVDAALQLNWLDRGRFLAVWFVLFLLPGVYLLGFLRMEGIARDENVGVARVVLGGIFLAFALSLVPGMFGRGLGELDAWVPLVQDSSALATSEGRTAWMKNQLNDAVAKAKQENKLVFVAFTGYACTNCHWMKANMFTRPEIASALGNFVLVELYTDGTDQASEENQKLQESKFGTVAIPFYAIMDPDQKVIASWGGIQRDASQFLAFLNTR